MRVNTPTVSKNQYYSVLVPILLHNGYLDTKKRFSKENSIPRPFATYIGDRNAVFLNLGNRCRGFRQPLHYERTMILLPLKYDTVVPD